MNAHPPSPPSPPPSRLGSPPSSDPGSPPPWHAANCASREVRKALDAYLRSRGLQEADVEDLRQRALLKLYLTPVPPPDLPGWLFRVSGGSQMPVSGRAEWQASAVAS